MERAGMRRINFFLIALSFSVCVSLFFLASAQAQTSTETSANQVSSNDRTGATLVATTESPRQTIASFLALRDAIEEAVSYYVKTRRKADFARILVILNDLEEMVDTSDVPEGKTDQVSARTVLALLDIFGRIPKPDLDLAPDTSELASENNDSFTIPGTPLRLLRIDDGLHYGEYLFSPQTIVVAPRFLKGIDNLPLKTTTPFTSWSRDATRLTGPWIPKSFAEALPDRLNQQLFGSPAWKSVAVLLVLSAIVYFIVMNKRRLLGLEKAGQITLLFVRLVHALLLIGLLWFFNNLLHGQILVAGALSDGVRLVMTVLFYGSLSWSLWLTIVLLFEALAAHYSKEERSVDRNMMRLVARIIGSIGAIWLMAYGLQRLGIPTLSLLAGLGVGGIAAALAIRPTLENLIGGFVLFLDKPIRVGDYCTFGSFEGVVERIGVRSTQVRALDRTLITIPNSQFADMELVNWAMCDQMMIQTTIGIRYETDSDQFRFVLAEIRRAMYAHPRIDNDTVRVRFDGFGDSSLNIQIRVYAKTREWNDFYAIREDIMFRIKQIVEASGSSFAFPSHTLYMSQDDGLDADKSAEAIRTVAQWRRQRELPFPGFSAAAREKIDDRLDYPPKGSPDYASDEVEVTEPEETLSIATEADLTARNLRTAQDK